MRGVGAVITIEEVTRKVLGTKVLGLFKVE